MNENWENKRFCVILRSLYLIHNIPKIAADIEFIQRQERDEGTHNSL